MHRPTMTKAGALLTVVLVTAIASEQLGTSCHQGTSPQRDNNERLRKLRNGFNHAFYQGPKSDYILVGKRYKNITASSLSACAVHCLQEDACKSFNFCQDAKLCELNSAVYSKNKSDLVPSSGCLYLDEEFHKFEVCLNGIALGMEDGRIPDNKISASSFFRSATDRSHAPEKARLNTQVYASAWAAAGDDFNSPWIQVDFTSPVIITGLITQGRWSGDYPNRQWVTSYTVAYGEDMVAWIPVNEADGTGPKEFAGNTDTDSLVSTTRFDPALDARFLRILPTGNHVYVSMRFEVVGCSQSTVAPAK